MPLKSLFLALALLTHAFAEKPNVLFICVDDLRPELKSLGVEHIHSPAMDSLVASGRAFTRHYVQAPTCGASRYALLTGKYATTAAYADGKSRKPGITPALEHEEDVDMKYTDGWITREAIKQMDTLAEKEEPFFLAVGIMKPHLPFACPKSYRDIYDGVTLPPIPHPDKPKGLSTWHASGEFFDQYNHNGRDPRKNPAYADEFRRSYAACVSYADAQVAQLLAHLEKTGLAKNTIIVLWGDHGWHLGEHNVWGKHTLFEESLLAPLAIRTPGMEKPGEKTAAVVESIDLYPTLCELTGVPTPDGLDGHSLTENLRNPAAKDRPAVSYFGNNETIRTEKYRLIRHNGKDGKGGKGGKQTFELYDHSGSDGKTTNLADKNPKLIAELNDILDEQLK